MLHYPHANWRLIQTPPARGAWNMAVDEAILEAIGRSAAIPTLRLFSWEPACLSLGYAQPSSDVDMEQLSQHGWDIVRRPTGGRAILHTDELTYSVIGPGDEPRLAGSVLESYQHLSLALLDALQRLNIPAESQAQALPISQGNAKGPVCFEVPSNYEITVNGKKLVGSAQARRREGVLQHGSFPLYGDLTRIVQALTLHNRQEPIDPERRQNAAQRILERATTAENVLGYRIEWETAAEAFIGAFQDTLNISLNPQELSAEEKERAEILVSEKYAHPAWTRRI